MMAQDGSFGVMHPATALMPVSLVGRIVSVIMSPAALSTHDMIVPMIVPMIALP